MENTKTSMLIGGPNCGCHKLFDKKRTKTGNKESVKAWKELLADKEIKDLVKQVAAKINHKEMEKSFTETKEWADKITKSQKVDPKTLHEPFTI